MRVALTGHRPQRLGLPNDETAIEWQPIRLWIAKALGELKNLIKDKQCSLDIYSGMADGCDIALAIIVSELKGITCKNSVKLHCILPCKEYNSSHTYYKYLKDNADEWVELSDEFYKGCDNVRDQYMVDHCDVLIAIWDGNKSGGVWSTIRKAQKAGKKIIYCPKEILKGE